MPCAVPTADPEPVLLFGRRRFRPAYVTRLQEIRRLVQLHDGGLERAYAELGAQTGDDRETFASEWQRIAEDWPFARVNRLIDEHNARYPLERSLPYDPDAGDYTDTGGRPYRRTPLDTAWVLDRFPARLGLAATG